MNAKNDRKYAVAMLILSVVYSSSAYSLDADFDPTHEKFYPFILGISMVILSLALMVWPSDQKVTWPNGGSLIKIGITFVGILVYALILHKIGFLICASVLMGICMWVFEANRKWILPTSIIVSISFYIIFDRLLGLTLPPGLLNFF